ncbi:30S ribosomal protein S16 [Candidatus Saccharibacteria bacterium]|nr:30S ribosomal protein S16 [Candidatus Saccharibacteria bacterium]
MLVIRIQRIGRTHLPVYRLVVQDSRRHPLSGRVVAEVGSYDPKTKKTVLDKEAIEKYLKNGAQPSTRVAKILSDNKIKLPDWVKAAPKKTAKVKHPEKRRKSAIIEA